MVRFLWSLSVCVVLVVICMRSGKYLFALRETRLTVSSTDLDTIEIRENCYQWYTQFLIRSAIVVGSITISCM
jgi:hypothetical protein